MPKDVRTRCNSVFDMVELMAEYREAIDYLCRQAKPDLPKYELTDVQRTILAEGLRLCTFRLTYLY
jgi:hypothetical protein